MTRPFEEERPNQPAVSKSEGFVDRRSLLSTFGGAAAVLASPRIVSAQSYPARPVRAIVTFAPGGTVDVYARLACQFLGQRLGQQFVVENLSGATGNRGTAQAARAEPDGYTLLFALSTHVVNASVFSSLPYDPIADFVPINLSVSSTHVVSAHPSLPARDAKEYVADLRARPNQNYAHGGIGTQGQLLAERLKVRQKLDMVGITYQGAGPAIQAVVANQIPSGWTTIASAGPFLAGGQLKAIGTSGRTRSQQLPNVPTMIEQGFPEIEGDTWVGVMAPKGTPNAIVAAINGALGEFLQQAAARQRLADVGFEVLNKGPAEFGRALEEDVAYWRKVVEETGVKIN